MVRVASAGTETSVARLRCTGSVPARWRACTSAVPTIHSWSMGSSLRSSIVTGTPRGTVMNDGAKRE